MCCVFNKFCQISTLSFHLVNSRHHGAVGNASAWQTRGREFEPVLMRYIFSAKCPMLSGRLVSLVRRTYVLPSANRRQNNG